MNNIKTLFLGILLCCYSQSSTRAQTIAADGRVEVPRRFVLTNNADRGEMGLDSGVTYTAQPSFTNPQDTTGKRLLDNDKPVADWNVVAGTNAPEQTVTFDLKRRYKLDEIALHFGRPQLPISVTASIAQAAAGPWQAVGFLSAESQTGPWWRLPLRKSGSSATSAQFIKLDFKGTERGWYINEVKIFGSAENRVQSAKPLDGRLLLAQRGASHATIVLGNKVFPNVLQAASLFQSVAQRMTGAQIPIVPESEFDNKSTAIFIGDSARVRKLGVIVEQTPFGDDRYILRGGETKGNFIALVGNDSLYGDASLGSSQYFRGSLFAVYDFFERQGCGWYGPEELWQVIPRLIKLTAPKLAVSEIPAVKWRRIWMNGLSWESPLRDAWRLGGTFIASQHSYDHLVPPAKYKEQHPEWFGAGQPDLTHPEVIRIAIETLNGELRAKPQAPTMTFAVSANDTGGYKEKPYKPEVGNIAAQQLYFINEIAKGLRRENPGRVFTLGMLGYWHSHDGPVPVLKAEPEVIVELVNQGNHAKPLEWPESPETVRNTGRNNGRELRAFEAWRATGGLKAIYEWWIPAYNEKLWKEAPWYDGATTVQNLRFWHRNGIRYVDYESQGEVNAGFPLRWAQYYIGSRALWNPKVDARQELADACRKLFGQAAPIMLQYYLLQEKAMRDTTEHVGNWSLPLPHLLYKPGVEEAGLTLLQKALEQTTDSNERARILIEMAQWKQLITINAAARSAQKKGYKVTLDGVAMNWVEEKIDAATVRELFDLDAKSELEVIEADGQNRRALPGEIYYLTGGVTFRTVQNP